VLFLVADNGYAISVPSSEQSPAPVNELVAGFRGLEVQTIDGRDYFEVRRRAPEIVARIRAGIGPTLLHATVTRPYSHSSADTQSKYRSVEELADETAHDPLVLLEQALIAGGVLDEEGAAAIRDEARRTVADASRRALAAPRPDPTQITGQVWDLPTVGRNAEEIFDDAADAGAGPVERIAMGEAIKRTLHEQMAADERIRVFGEDVADAREAVLANVEGKGGVFGCNAASASPAATTPRWPRPTSSGGPSVRPCGAYARYPRSSSSTTSGRPCSRSRVRRPPSAGVPTGPSRVRSCSGCRSAGT
jgi:2-oxoisovalerate dehydrogenase E1 component